MIASSRTRVAARVAVVLAAGVLASACGGGEDAATDGAMPTPGSQTPGSTVADPAATTPADTTGLDGQGLDGTGLDEGVADQAAAVPELVGDDVGGGFDAIGDSPLFEPRAATGESIAADEKDTTETTDTTTTEKAPATKYSGAQIYVNGTVHRVTIGGSFPKSNPVFELVDVNARDIEISLVAGEFTSDGGNGTFLDLGSLETILNASEQLTYKVKYLRPIVASDAVSF